MIPFKKFKDKEASIAVVGLGYVGLPLAVALARHFKVIGFDISQARITELNSGQDHTREVTSAALAASTAIFTADPTTLATANIIIVAVPTPIDAHKTPDLSPVYGASRTVGKNMGRDTVVVYESTVYPGVTEEVCVPVLEQESGLKFGTDFTVGYSPERINPGDKVHTLETITKIVSGSDAATTKLLAEIYGTVVTAGIHQAPSIKVAEAAKVIENTQRDINIALMNELAMIFNKMNIDTMAVLQAAGTKWNFLKFTPGLVGGHCIGVDPYYLTFKAQEIGYTPRVILAGREINDNMGKYIAETTVKKLINADCRIKGSRIAVLGFTFKENVPDLRNTRVIDIIRELEEFGAEVLPFDPEADKSEAMREYNVKLCSFDELTQLDAVILAVPHTKLKELTPSAVKAMCRLQKPVCIDVKAVWSEAAATAGGFDYWRL